MTRPWFAIPTALKSTGVGIDFSNSEQYFD